MRTMRSQALPMGKAIPAARVPDRQATGCVAKAEGVGLSFGGQRILDQVSFSLLARSAILLRGDNGAGKTTLLNVLSGFVRPDFGRIHLWINGSNLDVTRCDPVEVARAGVGRLWQDIRLFPTMTVIENVLAATPGFVTQNSISALVAWSRVRRQEKDARQEAMENLRRVGMEDLASSSADKLSVGQMKRVAIARLLQSNAELWLLDEPLAGLDKGSADSFMVLLDEVRRLHGKTFVLIEHQHERIAPTCDETWYLADGVLRTGRSS